MADPAFDILSLDPAFPIALLPVRIETRFVGGPSPQLLVRVYPDEIAAELGHLMTSDAAEAAREFWRQGWNVADELDAWRRLIARYPSHVAGALVRAQEPSNIGARLIEPEPTWSYALPAVSPETATTRVLPDCWFVVGYYGGVEVLRTNGNAIVEPLALSFRRDVAEDDPALIDHDGLAVEPALLWTVDFDAAVAVGMAMRIPITPADYKQGFDRLVVYGVKTTLDAADGATRLRDLLTSHQGSRGLALVPQGTPTNNSTEGTAGYPPPDDAERSFAIERGAPLTSPGSDGALLGRALGVSPDVFDHVEGAGGSEQRRARAMNQALWPCTLGYFLEQMMSPMVGDDMIGMIRDHFADNVRGRGPLPAFRVGRVPYGVLPVTPLAGATETIENALEDRLNAWQPRVLERLPWVARVGATSDPDADLLGILALDASTREVRLREVVGPAYLRAVLQLFDTDPTLSSGERAMMVGDLMAALGMTGSPRVGGMTFGNNARRIDRPLVTADPLSEADGLIDNYIGKIKDASTIADLDPPGAPPPSALARPLLYHLLRQGALVEYHRVAVEAAIAVNAATTIDRREVELFQIAPGTLTRLSRRQRFAQTLSTTDGLELGTWLFKLPSDPADRRWRVQAQVEAFTTLEHVPTAELERLLTETLDTCSHRLDAWNTSLATRRLWKRRGDNPTGIYLGAYAFVENLRPSKGPAGTAGGYIHAPSASHAAAAAILRNGHLTHGGSAETAIDLSSQRVRRALALFDGVRHGQPAGAVLGYWFERALHDRHLDRYIAPFRRLYPLARLPGSPPEQSTEQLAAANVTNGLALRDALLGLEPPPWGDTSKMPTVVGGDQAAVAACLAQLADDVDAAADLLAAESIYQVVQGNTDRAGANLASGAGTGSLPTPGIVTPPASGTAFTHRVAIVLGAPPATPIWPLAGARCKAEPRLDAWLGRQLGSPAAIRCRALYDATETTVTMAELGLSAIDFVVLARRTGAAGSELAARVEAHVRAPVTGIGGDVTVDFGRPTNPPWPLDVFSFDEAFEIARLTGDLVLGARPLVGDDLLPPHAAGAAYTIDTADMNLRVTNTLGPFGIVRTAVDDAIAAAGSPTPLPSSLDDLRAALWSAAAFGLREAVPVDLAGTDATARAALLTQGAVVATDLTRRATTAGAATGALDKLTALFGPELPILTSFTPSNRADLDDALATPPSDSISNRRWLQQMARLREPLDRLRLAQLASGAITGATATTDGVFFEIAQLPHTAGAPWIGQSFDPDDPAQRPRPGTVSIAVHRPTGFDTGGSWSGLLVDDWSEVIPAASRMTSYAVHHPTPGAEAPQCVVLAVAPPSPDITTWAQWIVEACIDQTFDVARMRAVDSDLLQPYALLVPCIYLAANIADDAIRSPLGEMRIEENQVLAPE